MVETSTPANYSYDSSNNDAPHPGAPQKPTHAEGLPTMTSSGFNNMRTYSELDLEILGNQLGQLLGMKRNRDGLWVLASGEKTGLGLIRTLSSLLKNVECGCLEEESTRHGRAEDYAPISRAICNSIEL
jgi:hypothetical protein